MKYFFWKTGCFVESTLIRQIYVNTLNQISTFDTNIFIIELKKCNCNQDIMLNEGKTLIQKFSPHCATFLLFVSKIKKNLPIYKNFLPETNLQIISHSIVQMFLQHFHFFLSKISKKCPHCHKLFAKKTFRKVSNPLCSLIVQPFFATLWKIWLQKIQNTWKIFKPAVQNFVSFSHFFLRKAQKNDHSLQTFTKFFTPLCKFFQKLHRIYQFSLTFCQNRLLL